MNKPAIGATERLFPTDPKNELVIHYTDSKHSFQVVYTSHPTRRLYQNTSGLWLLIGAIVALAAFSQEGALGFCVLLALVAVAMLAERQEG